MYSETQAFKRALAQFTKEVRWEKKRYTRWLEKFGFTADEQNNALDKYDRFVRTEVNKALLPVVALIEDNQPSA